MFASSSTDPRLGQRQTPPALSIQMAIWIPVLLGLLTAVGPVSTDIYLPAFPALEASLRAPSGSAQMTLAIWFVGLAIGQLVVGPVSDRFGRKMPIMVGTLIYTLASVGCAVASGMSAFLVWRLIAALGASALLVIPAASVRDQCTGHTAARMLSRLVLIMGVVPVLAPTLGGCVLLVASWRVIFWVSALYGAVAMLLVWKTLPETLPADQRSYLSPVALMMRYITLLHDRNFATNAAISGCGAFVCFAYLSAAPTIFLRLFHLTPPEFGAIFGLNAMCMIAAVQLNAALVGKVGVSELLRRTVRWSGMGAVCLVVLACAAGSMFDLSAVSVRVVLVACMTLTLSVVAMAGPNAMVGALSGHAQLAGSASALLGTLQYVLGAMAGVAVSFLPGHALIPMALAMALGALGMCAADLFRIQVEDTAEGSVVAESVQAEPVYIHADERMCNDLLPWAVIDNLYDKAL